VNALDSVGDLKAPKPYGMHSVFYKKFRHVVGEKVTEEVVAALNGGPVYFFFEVRSLKLAAGRLIKNLPVSSGTLVRKRLRKKRVLTIVGDQVQHAGRR
jgi:hypothetical protein